MNIIIFSSESWDQVEKVGRNFYRQHFGNFYLGSHWSMLPPYFWKHFEVTYRYDLLGHPGRVTGSSTQHECVLWIILDLPYRYGTNIAVIFQYRAFQAQNYFSWDIAEFWKIFKKMKNRQFSIWLKMVGNGVINAFEGAKWVSEVHRIQK